MSRRKAPAIPVDLPDQLLVTAMLLKPFNRAAFLIRSKWRRQCGRSMPRWINFSWPRRHRSETAGSSKVQIDPE